ncbi:amino acid adenylation domain-containing protein [Streptomyces sp. AC550_RSS872]|uniref:amino acid adenylation domain-containing protein n=1 Tax=Streptomyces sp. AC550_RSS872 TaxID=2823689 RepID=UPI001C25534B|nr:amino acid adenylation domain-containing protein [Streptomyces sp. AC550_RSS872]
MKTIRDAFEAQATRTPDATAVRAARTYTYRELSARAAALGEEILAHTRAGSLVALDAAGPAGGALGILAAAGSGCAVLPLNRESPPAHRERVLANARPSLVLRETAEGAFTAEPVPAAGGLFVPREPAMADIAYVMYTSGSTGLPKGVMVPHTALLDRLAGLAATPGLTAGETMVAATALSFDISMAEMLLPLMVGASFLVVPDEVRFDPYSFKDFVDEHAPQVIQATPSFWRMLLAAEWQGAEGARLWCGGEALTPELARRLLPRGAQLWNLYGPTEATIWATAARVESPDVISLGRPLDGSGLYLAAVDDTGATHLDETVTEPGTDGEIVLYGAGIALGYLERDDLTAERFPTRDIPGAGGRLYRTGDRARYRADGSLEFLGRADDQIKLRGHRIELGEIEAVLEEHPEITAAVAVLRDADRPQHASITAHVTARGQDVSGKTIRAWLRERLPASHCPSRIVVHEALPRTTAGKVDRVLLAGE